ncbi:MAG TPA: hypothetical protein PLU93_00395 [Treponemataceae bacterium]|nr:hypothetical protein [Treponemataceae bacterium]
MEPRTNERRHPLYARYPPSAPCSCPTCVSFCARPGWWLVSEARAAIDRGLARRMMLEISPELDLGVLSPAFRGNEGLIATRAAAGGGCTFLALGRCSLHGTDLQPIECRHCHHARAGSGDRCHRDVERDWASSKGRRLVRQWVAIVGLEVPACAAAILAHAPARA